MAVEDALQKLLDENRRFKARIEEIEGPKSVPAPLRPGAGQGAINPPAPDRWRCVRFANPHRRDPGAQGVDVMYENNFVAAETLPKVAGAEPATIITANGPCIASILIFQGRIPKNDGDPLPFSKQKDGLVIAPVIIEAFSAEPTPTTAAGETVQPAQNPITAARANGNMPRRMTRGWIEVP